MIPAPDGGCVPPPGSHRMAARATTPPAPPPVVLSFDVEEHHRIEAAVGLAVPAAAKADYAARMERSTRGILDQLAAGGAVATFFVVGEVARTHPRLVRDIAAAGHEVGSHGHDHTRVDRFSPDEFRQDLLRSKGALEDAAGVAVRGYRAPTFSISHRTPWAVDMLAEAGYAYDSSVFPVRHDRYGVPAAPREPFAAGGDEHDVVELPPATWRVLGQNLPVAGGGYFRLFPLFVLRAGVGQLAQRGAPAVLYFHPWEFDPGQPKLPLGRVSRWRTYVGVSKTAGRLDALIREYAGRFCTAGDLADGLDAVALPRFALGSGVRPAAEVFAGRVVISGRAPASRVPGPRARSGPTGPSPAPAPRAAAAGTGRPGAAAGA